MAEYHGPATDNEAEMIATMVGRIPPDIYATDSDNPEKMSSDHPKRIHNDVFAHYGQDTEVTDCKRW